MAQKYYNSEETAKIFDVSVEEIKKMLERRELHGYRDGADWKFKVEDIDRLAQERKAASSADSPLEEGVNDVLLSEVALGQPGGLGTSGTVIAMDALARDAATSDIRLASDFDIIKSSEELPTPRPTKTDTSSSKTGKLDELDLTLEEDLTLEDSTAMLPGKSAADTAGASKSAIDLGSQELEDDDLVLGGSGTGSDVTIGGDSGISLLDAAADSGLSLEQPLDLSSAEDAALELDEGDMLIGGQGGDPIPLKTDDDFLLTPLEEMTDADESESGSQVIALDTEADEAAGMLGAGAGGSMAAMLDEDLSSQPSLDLGMGSPLGGSPLSAGLSEVAPSIQSTGIFSEPPYTNLQIAGLATCAVLLMFCGMMMYDLLRNIWSWQGAYPVNSSLMDMILNLF